MTRRAYPKDLVRRAHLLRSRGLSYKLIADELGVGASTVRDWVTYYSRGQA
ncbi:helix-turn-helix domain-containing protein [Hydrocarboniphaga effusa]|uniref:helix-turn-helix domain-containing protein n=1 Tax=Hydrocarboniphaga effusa TaxID=243629 RepID=UPI00398C1481